MYNGINVTAQRGFLRWIQFWFKLIDLRDKSPHTGFRITVVTSRFGQLFVLLTGEFFRLSPCCEGFIYLLRSETLHVPSTKGLSVFHQ